MRPKNNTLRQLNLQEVSAVAQNTRVQHDARITELEGELLDLKNYVSKLEKAIREVVIPAINKQENINPEPKQELVFYKNNQNRKRLLLNLVESKEALITEWTKNFLISVMSNATWTEKQFKILNETVLANYPNGHEFWFKKVTS